MYRRVASPAGRRAAIAPRGDELPEPLGKKLTQLPVVWHPADAASQPRFPCRIKLLYCAGMSVSPSPPGVETSARTGASARSLPWFVRWRGRLEWVAVATIFALAALLRFGALEHAQFRQDDIGLWATARDFAANPRLLTEGISSSLGIPNGPFMVYLLAPAAWLRSLSGAYLTVAFLNFAAVVLLWGFARRFHGPNVALLTALIVAVNPWAVIFSRRLWGNDMMAPFVVLLVWSLCELAARGRRRDQVLPFVWYAIVAQVYVVALAQGLTLLTGLVLAYRRIRPGWLILGAIAGGAILAPYLVPVVLPGLGTLGRLTGSGGAPPVWDLSSVSYLFHLVSSEGYQAFAHRLGADTNAATGPVRWLALFFQAALALGILRSFWWALGTGRERRRPAAVYLLPVLAVGVPVVLLIWHSASIPVMIYYLLIGLPFHYLLVALGIVWIPHLAARAATRLRWSPGARRTLRRGAAAGVAVLVATQLGVYGVLAARFFGSLDRYFPGDDYGPPLSTTRRLETELLQAGDGNRSLFVLGAEERDLVLAQYLRLDHPHVRGIHAGRGLVWPAGDTSPAYLAEVTDRTATGRLWNERIQAERLIPVPGSGVTYGIYRPGPAAARTVLDDLGRLEAPVYFDNLVALDAVVAESAIGPLGDPYVAVMGRVLAPLPWEQTPTLSLRLEDSTGQVHDSQDVPIGVIADLQPGDTFLAWFDRRAENLPPGPLRARIGLYLRDGDRPRDLPALDATGRRVARPVSDWTYAPAADAPAPAVSVDQSPWPGVRLRGLDVRPADGDPSAWNVRLHWAVQATPPGDLTVFVHLVDPSGRMVAQQDGPPARGRWPASLWRPGDLVQDEHRVVVGQAVPPGSRLRIGLYDPATGVRWGGPDAVAEIPWPAVQPSG